MVHELVWPSMIDVRGFLVGSGGKVCGDWLARTCAVNSDCCGIASRHLNLCFNKVFLTSID